MPAKAANYLDLNASAPLRPQVVEALSALLSIPPTESPLYNPSSLHFFGRRAKHLLTEARDLVGASFSGNVDTSEEVFFVSSGTEANQFAIRSRLGAAFKTSRAPHWITTPVEHESVLCLVPWFKAQGGAVSILPVDSNGSPQVSELQSLICEETALVSLIWVNNETGVITDVERAAGVTRSRGVPLHLDAAQAWGKIPVDVIGSGASSVSFSAHKIGALVGCGVLWRKKGYPLMPLIYGVQEKNLRGGTENLMGAFSAGIAAKTLNPQAFALAMKPLLDRLETLVLERIPGAIINGLSAQRVANTLSLSFREIKSDTLVMALDLEGYCVSSGAACSSGAAKPSHVLLAMGHSPELASSSIRVSLGLETSWESLVGFVSALERCTSRVRQGKQER
ncbi:cysteine desulfurase family protein [Bdellovibrionota bacterium FG-2]